MPVEQPFAVTPVRIRIETTGRFRAPEYAGALFRGGFGQFFRDLACVTKAQVCQGCAHQRTCSYSVVFETPVEPERFTVLRKYPNAPHPFVLTPPLDGRTEVGAGAELCVDVTLIGKGVHYLPHFVWVFEEMGAAGHYGGRFRVRSVESLVDGGMVYDGASRRMVGEAAKWTGTDEGRVGRMRLEWVTPLRMRTEGRYNASPEFAQIAQALLRRVGLLEAIYGTGDGDGTGRVKELMPQADRVETERKDFRMYRWSRTSGRTGGRVQMDGVVGGMVVRGELGALAPWFRLGEWVHVGSGTSMGMGKYRMEVEA